MKRLTQRQALENLVATAPTGLHSLAATALGLYDRWEILQAIDALDACVGWSDVQEWNLDAFIWMADLCSQLADRMAENAVLDGRGTSRN